MKPKALIVDLDGTLADIRVRLKHISGTKKDWTSFNKSIETDILDDRQKVVDMWRAEGLIVLQCAPGNF